MKSKFIRAGLLNILCGIIGILGCFFYVVWMVAEANDMAIEGINDLFYVIESAGIILFLLTAMTEGTFLVIFLLPFMIILVGAQMCTEITDKKRSKIENNERKCMVIVNLVIKLCAILFYTYQTYLTISNIFGVIFLMVAIVNILSFIWDICVLTLRRKELKNV